MLLRSLLLLRTCLAVAVCSLLPAVQGGASLTIDTIPAWNGQNFVGSFGERNTATYGQTVTAPGNVLESFKFLVDDKLNTDVVDFEAFVFAWDGEKAIGAWDGQNLTGELYRSGPMSTTNNGGQDGYEEIELLTGGVSVTAGAEYVLFLSVSLLFDGVPGVSNWAAISQGALPPPDLYMDGAFVFQNNGSDFSQPFEDEWQQRSGDLAFQAIFTPEPGTLPLLALGLAGLVARRRSAG